LDSAAVLVCTVDGEIDAAKRAAGRERLVDRRVVSGRRNARSLSERSDSLAGVANASDETARGGQRWREAHVVRDSEAEVLRRVLAMWDTALAAANVRANLLGDAAVRSVVAVQRSDFLLRVTRSEAQRPCRVLVLLPCFSR
jgi:uncharacterized protein YigA (DUF484 family)